MDEHALSPATIAANLRRAQDRRDRAAEEFQAAREELDFWNKARELYGGPAEADELSGDAILDELLPGARVPARPSLRQAIILVMRAGPDREWSVEELASMLGMNNWLPKGFEPGKRISDAAGAMVNEGHMQRAGRGRYRLSWLLADALTRALPPITDYTRAAELGLPVPDRPAASEGLLEE